MVVGLFREIEKFSSFLVYKVGYSRCNVVRKDYKVLDGFQFLFYVGRLLKLVKDIVVIVVKINIDGLIRSEDKYVIIFDFIWVFLYISCLLEKIIRRYLFEVYRIEEVLFVNFFCKCFYRFI